MLKMPLLQAMKMIQAGADIIDIGGQSTRPGAQEISLEAELSPSYPRNHRYSTTKFYSYLSIPLGRL
jgi:dihydropteroate synthase